MRSLADVIAFNTAHADAELRWFGQDTFEQAITTTDEAAYKAARANSLRLAGKDGIDHLLAANHVALLVAPTEGPAWPIDLVSGDHGLQVGAGSLPAIAGYPHLTVPMGAIEASRSACRSSAPHGTMRMSWRRAPHMKKSAPSRWPNPRTNRGASGLCPIRV